MVCTTWLKCVQSGKQGNFAMCFQKGVFNEVWKIANTDIILRQSCQYALKNLRWIQNFGTEIHPVPSGQVHYSQITTILVIIHNNIYFQINPRLFQNKHNVFYHIHLQGRFKPWILRSSVEVKGQTCNNTRILDPSTWGSRMRASICTPDGSNIPDTTIWPKRH